MSHLRRHKKLLTSDSLTNSSVYCLLSEGKRMQFPGIQWDYLNNSNEFSDWTFEKNLPPLDQYIRNFTPGTAKTALLKFQAQRLAVEASSAPGEILNAENTTNNPLIRVCARSRILKHTLYMRRRGGDAPWKSKKSLGAPPRGYIERWALPYYKSLSLAHSHLLRRENRENGRVILVQDTRWLV